MSNKCLDDELYDIYIQDGKQIIESLREIYDKGRADAIEEYRKEMQDMIEGNEEFTDWQKYEILECNELVAEQLKESKIE